VTAQDVDFALELADVFVLQFEVEAPVVKLGARDVLAQPGL
jgi:hypothetical protein